MGRISSLPFPDGFSQEHSPTQEEHPTPQRAGWLPGRQQGIDRAPQLFPQGQDTGRDGAPSGPLSSALGGSYPRSIYLTAMREDNHHAAVQAAVVPPRQLLQSLDHLLREKVADEPEH